MITGRLDYKPVTCINSSNDKSPIKVPWYVYDDATDKFITIEEHRAKYHGEYFYFL